MRRFYFILFIEKYLLRSNIRGILKLLFNKFKKEFEVILVKEAFNFYKLLNIFKHNTIFFIRLNAVLG
jgi:hypothetical protein